jgi:hypothetical protein
MALADALRAAFEEPEPFFDLIQEMNLKLASEEVIPPPTADQTYRVSRLVKLCPREEVLRHIHQISKVEKIEPRLRRIFDIGKAFHTLAQNEWFGQWGWLEGHWLCRRCHRVHKDSLRPKTCGLECPTGQCQGTDFFYIEIEPADLLHGVTAHVDGILRIGKKKKVLELKTCNAMQFKLVADMKRRPQPAHVLQTQLYMWLTGLKEGIILYMDKDESLLAMFEVKYDPAVIEKALEALALAREGMRTKIVPPREVCDSASCSRAKACPVRNLCFQKGKV